MKEEPADSAGEAEETVQIAPENEDAGEEEGGEAENSRDLVTPDMAEEEAEVKSEAGLYL